MRGGDSPSKTYKVAIVWRGDAAAREAATPQNNRFYRVFEELAAVGIHAEPRSTTRPLQTMCASSCEPRTGCSSGSTRSDAVFQQMGRKAVA
jgi:hypothetical protein